MPTLALNTLHDVRVGILDGQAPCDDCVFRKLCKARSEACTDYFRYVIDGEERQGFTKPDGHPTRAVYDYIYDETQDD